jgi:uncharacterized HAD superfamily protein
VIVEREFGKLVTYEQLTDFDIGASCGLRPEERNDLYRIVHQPDELMKMAPIGSAISVLQRWTDAGYEVAIVTGRPPDTYEPSVAWLAMHGVPYRSFTMVDKYSRFATANTIAISLDELAAREYCWAVEDSLPMARYLAGEMKLPVALIDCPWNQTDAEQARVTRFHDWQAITAALPALSVPSGGTE